MAHWHSCENCIYLDKSSFDSKNYPICKFKLKSPSVLINRSMPSTDEPNSCKYFNNKTVKAYRLIENILIQEYGKDNVSKYTEGDEAIHFYDELNNKSLIVKIEEEK